MTMQKINLHEVKTTTFPDGEPLITALNPDEDVTISCSINSPTELFKLCQLVEIHRRSYRGRKIYLDIKYLMGQRMDRPISNWGPFTLKVVADIINSLKADTVKILCPHSEVATALINHSIEDETGLLKFYHHTVSLEKPDTIVLPDVGMAKRYYNSLAASFNHWQPNLNLVTGHKKRDMSTGKLSGFKIVEGKPKGRCLIIDDLCDGGGTFSGLAEVLREAGAENISLAVVHGIFSKGLPLKGIDSVWCTNSYFAGRYRTNNTTEGYDQLPPASIFNVF